MANDFNQFCFIGRLVKDCELKYTQSGTACCEFSIAVNKKTGEKETVSFFDIVIWGKYGETLSQYLVKGQQVLASGEIDQDKWQKDGKTFSKIKFTARTMQLLGKAGNNQQVNNKGPADNNLHLVDDPWKDMSPKDQSNMPDVGCDEDLGIPF